MLRSWVNDVPQPLPVSVPQVFSANNTPKRPRANSSHRFPTRQVEPDSGVGSRPHEVGDPLPRVVAVHYPCLLVGEHAYDVLELIRWQLSPACLVKHWVELEVWELEGCRQGSCHRRLTRAGTANYCDTSHASDSGPISEGKVAP